MKKILIILIIALALTTCDNTTTTHTHTWSDWQSNAEQHWKECSCGEKTDIGNHTGNPCTVCEYEEIATVPQPTQKILSFGKVTISSPDEHLPSAWNDLCNEVVSALENAYDTSDMPPLWDLVIGGGEAPNGVVFGSGVEIVLVNNLAKNWEVKKTLPEGDGVKGVLYIKIDSVNSIGKDYDNAFVCVAQNNPATSQN